MKKKKFRLIQQTAINSRNCINRLVGTLKTDRACLWGSKFYLQSISKMIGQNSRGSSTNQNKDKSSHKHTSGNRAKKNQLDAQIIFSIFPQSLQVCMCTVRMLPHGNIRTVHTTYTAALKTTTHPKTRCRKPYAATQCLMLLMMGVCTRNMSS